MTPPLLNNRYRLIRELGDGGFGKTFLVEDCQMPSGRRCVIKQLKPVTNNPQIYQLVQARFQREAAILEELGEGSTQIPKLYGYFSEGGRFYLVQEWIQGQTLTHKVQQQGLLSESSVKEILKSLLPVLDYVHSKGIVHRDIKPDNIILRDRDGKPVLIDFGAVRETMGTVMNSQGKTTSSIVIGTPGFMPSEQAAGRPVYSSDLYSLGLTAIYLLTGKMPQELENDPQTGEIIWRPYALSVSPSLATVLDKAIQSHARDRYPTARAMLDALHGSSSVPPTVLPGGSYSPPPTKPSSQSGMVGGGGTFNTSVPVPSEVQGWNWGAFLLSPLWCLTNRVWIGLISWIPYIGLPIPFILGAKGNVWAWRSRPWRSVQDFQAHQRAWAKGGAIAYGSFTALMVLLFVIGSVIDPEPDISNNNQTDPVAESNDNSTPEPTAPSASPDPTDPLNTPPQVSVGGRTEQTTAPNAFIDGVWRLQFSVGATRHDSVLYMKGPLGRMRTQYFNPATSKTETVDQIMKLWSSSQGLILKGYNPVDADTQNPHPTYSADEFLFQQRPDGTLYIDNCSGGRCSQVRAEFVGPDVNQN